MRPALSAVLLLSLLPGIAAAQAGTKPAGTWQCQSSLGPAVLEFRNDSVLSYGGQPMQYRIIGSSIVVAQDGMPVQYGYTLRGSQLDIVTPEGEPIRCAKSDGASSGQQARSAPPPAAGRGQFNHLLQGQLCSWSGSSSSGNSYSSTKKAFFDGRGRFGTGSESSFNVTSRDSGGNELGSASAYGGSDGAGGTYEVTSPQVGAPIRVKWDTGEDDVAFVHHVYGGRITEVKYGKMVFGAGLCE